TGPDLLLSRTGVVMGTAGYMSPEQARGEKLDARTDMFSFGLVLYEMATGQQAFEGKTGAALHAAILGQTPTPARQLNPMLPHKLQTVIRHALEKSRDLRYQSAADIRKDLEIVKRERQRKPVWVRVSLAATIATLLLAGIFFWVTKIEKLSPQSVPLKLQQLTSNSAENHVGSGAISPDGKYLAYTDLQGIHVKLIGTSETTTVLPPESLKNARIEWGIVAWFPDSTKFLANLFSGEQHPTSIWTASILGGVPILLREDAEAWSISHDGSLIAFAKNHGTAGPHEIWVMGPNGENERKLLSGEEDMGDVRFSPDDKRFVYLQNPDSSGTREYSLLSRGVAGGPSSKLVTSQRLRNHLWLPDGR